jgi:hypothetical protein
MDTILLHEITNSDLPKSLKRPGHGAAGCGTETKNQKVQKQKEKGRNTYARN